MSKPLLMQVSLFSDDFVALSKFYADLLDLPENEAMRSDIFRGRMAGDVMIGFSALSAYEMLGLEPRRSGDGDQTAFTFGASSMADVEDIAKRCVEMGGTVVKDPFETYYGWYLAVLRDPEGNAFRVAFALEG